MVVCKHNMFPKFFCRNSNNEAEMKLLFCYSKSPQIFLVRIGFLLRCVVSATLFCRTTFRRCVDLTFLKLCVVNGTLFLETLKKLPNFTVVSF